MYSFLGKILGFIISLFTAFKYGEGREKNKIADANKEALQKAQQTEAAINKLPATDVFDRFNKL